MQKINQNATKMDSVIGLKIAKYRLFCGRPIGTTVFLGFADNATNFLFNCHCNLPKMFWTDPYFLSNCSKGDGI